MATISAWSRASDVPAHVHDSFRDSKRPIFHPLAPRGWSSDPCGPILYKGRYHLFYQHQHASCQWYWGLCWDHVVSDDLVHWKNLPPAVVPTPGGPDADGCFSGTVEFDPELGVPVILYTGVYLKTNTDSVAAHGLPPPEHDPGTRFVEKQLAAVPADPDDPDLTFWVKLPTPVMSLPPAGLNISCWRDPFCLQRPAAAGGNGDDWVVLLASGIRGVGGAVLRFRSKHFTHGWVFDGVLADGDNNALGIKGQDWECPILARLPCVSRSAAIAAIAASSAAICAATTAKLQGDVNQAPTRSSSRSDIMSEAGPGTPLLKGCAKFKANSASLSSISRFDGSCLSLGAAAVAAAADDAASHSSSGQAPCSATVSSTDGAAFSAASAVANTIAAAGTGGLELPLTEPALAAATSAAEAAPISHDDAILSHPAVNVDAWVEEQTQQQVGSAAAAADVVALVSAMTADDAVVIIADDDAASDSSAKQQQVVPASNFNSSSSSDGGGKRWWLCMSPDACNNPITWWLGDYDGQHFDIAAADGPHRLDLGTTLYAATLWEDPKGRQLLYGWIQEHRRVPTPPALCDEYSYAGCISTPRVLQLVGEQLWQTPLPELTALRTSVCWRARDLHLSPHSQLVPLEVVSGTHLDINITLLPQAATVAGNISAAPAAISTAYTADLDAALATEGARAGLVFKSWRPDGKGAAVLSFNWSSGLLVFDFDGPFPDAYNPHPVDTPERRRVGGRLKHYTPGDALSLRVLLDGSAVEVFTSTGETLTTRVYRGHPPKCACAGCGTSAGTAAPYVAHPTLDSSSSSSSACVEDETGIALFASGAAVTVSELSVWEMGSCWVLPSCIPPQPPALLQQQQLAAAHAASATAGAGAGADMVHVGVPVMHRIKSETAAQAAVHGHTAGTATQTSAAAAAAAGADELVHHPAGDQAVVQEAFLEKLQITTNN